MSFVIVSGSQPTIAKDPDSSLVYGIDVADVLAPGDEVTGATVNDSTGVTAGSPAADGTVVSARVSGGAVGVAASLTLGWSTAAGDSDERTIYFDIKER